MRSWNKTGLLAAAFVITLPAVLAAPGVAHAAPAPVVTQLPIAVTNGADVVAAGDREFVSGGAGGTQIAVLDAAGAVVGTIDGLPGPTDLTLSNDRRTLYVALPSANAIAAFDTGSLVESARYSTGDEGDCPRYIALTGRYLWFGYSCEAGNGDIGRIDLLRQPAQVTLGHATGTYFYDAPMLASALRNNAVLLAGEVGSSPTTVNSFSIAGGKLTPLSNTRELGSNLGDLALDPAGKTAYSANGAPYHFPSVPVDDLEAPSFNYDAEPYPVAVEVSRDGTKLVGGIDGTYEPDVYFYTIGNTTPLSTYEVGSGQWVMMDGGLAFAPNGRKVFALSTDELWDPTTNAHLHVIPVPAA